MATAELVLLWAAMRGGGDIAGQQFCLSRRIERRKGPVGLCCDRWWRRGFIWPRGHTSGDKSQSRAHDAANDYQPPHSASPTISEVGL